MRAKTVNGVDGRTWLVRRSVEWSRPATGDDFEHDVDGGRAAVVLILSALFVFWVIMIVWSPTYLHVPSWLWLFVLAVAVFFPIRWWLRRPWTLVAETVGSYDPDLPPEKWTGLVRGGAKAKEELRIVVRRLRTQGTPAHAYRRARRREESAREAGGSMRVQRRSAMSLGDQRARD